MAYVGEVLRRLQAEDFVTANYSFMALATHVGRTTRVLDYRCLADTAEVHSAQPPDSWHGVVAMVEK